MHGKWFMAALFAATSALTWIWMDVFEEAGRQDRAAAEAGTAAESAHG